MQPKETNEKQYLTLIRQALALLDSRDRFLVFSAIIIFTLLNLLDLAGVLLIGLVVSLATQSVIGNPVPSALERIFQALGASDLRVQSIVAILATLAAALLVLKTILNLLFAQRFNFFLANREARITTRLFNSLFKSGLDEIKSKNLSEYQHALTLGSSQAITTLIGSSISFLSELFLQLILAITLLVYSPSLFLITTVYFSLIAIIVSKLLGNRAQEISRLQAEMQKDSSAIIYNMIGGFREIRSSGKMNYFVSEFKDSKYLNAKLGTKHAMLGQYSKYIFEIAAVLAAILFAGYSFFTLTAIEAVSSLAIFLAASSRIAPSVLRLQLIVIQIRGALGASKIFLSLCNKYLVSVHGLNGRSDDENFDISSLGKFEKNRLIQIENIHFKYKGGKRFILKGLNLDIELNSQCAIVGSSGAGKSTLVDLLLGILEPQKGIITIAGLSPRNFISQFPGQIQYVPQDIHLFGKSYAENVALGEIKEDISVYQVKRCLNAVGLLEEIKGKENGIWGELNDRGTNLSGGQRQRLGIARALYTNPKILILDEATSSLDAVSESQIIAILEKLKQNLTVVVIAHRLSTVINSDKVVYLDDGRITAIGSFKEVRKHVAVFDKQAKLMGL